MVDFAGDAPTGVADVNNVAPLGVVDDRGRRMLVGVAVVGVAVVVGVVGADGVNLE